MSGIFEEGDVTTTPGEEIWARWVRRTLDQPLPTPTLLLLEGPAGAGKTRLLDQLREQSAAAGRPYVVLTFTTYGVIVASTSAQDPATAPSDQGRPGNGPAEPPNGPNRRTGPADAPGGRAANGATTAQSKGPPSDPSADQARSSGQPPSAPGRRTVTPSIGAGAPGRQEAPMGQPPSASESRTSTGPRPAPRERFHPDPAALARDLARLSESTKSLLLIADDVHRAGPLDADLVRQLLERPPTGLAAVLAYRPEELRTPGLALGHPVDHPARLTLTRVTLEPLDTEQVRQLAEERLGQERCPPELIARLRERSAGVPQVVVDLLGQLQDAYGQRDRYTARDLDDTGTPPRLAELITGRLVSLPEQDRLIVFAAAVLDGPASAVDLHTVAGVCADRGRSALLAALRAAALKEYDRGRYDFPVPLAAQAVYRRIPGPVRQDMHARAAEVLSHRHPPEAIDWVRLAAHRLRGGQIRGWFKAVERAARQCAAAGEHQTAIDLLEQVLSRPDVPMETRARLAGLLAHSAVLGLHTDQTVRVLRQMLDEQSLPSAVRGRIRLDLGLVLYNQAGRGLQGWVELEQAAEELEGQPALAARAMAALSMPVMSSVPLERNAYWLERVRKVADRSGDEEVRTAVAANSVAILLETGDPSAWQVLEGLRSEAAVPARAPHVARGLVNAADAALWLGHPGRVAEFLDEGVELAAKTGAAYVEQDGRGTSLLLDWMTGHWDGLGARARAFLGESAVMPGPGADARLVLGMLGLAQGEWQQMAAWFAGDARPLPLGSPLPHIAAAAGGLVRTALARGDVEVASDEAAKAWDRLRDKGVWAWAADLAPWAVEAAVRADRPAAARTMIEEFESGLGGLDRDSAPSAAAALDWCRGILLEAAGGPADAVACYRRASQMFTDMPRPYAALLTAEAADQCVLKAAAHRHDQPGPPDRPDRHRPSDRSTSPDTPSTPVSSGVAGASGAPRPTGERSTGKEQRPSKGAAAVEDSPDSSASLASSASDGSAEGWSDDWPDDETVTRALESLASCVEQLTRLGAGWDAARVRATLRSHDPAAVGSRRRGRPSYGDQLSPREQEVVDLASGGLTNREIATTLHLSPRTVEQHISRARRKLESQSRQPLNRPRGQRDP
ncbi:LuxR C-terminal-related transcriptional regulator [Streptomyces sp. NPDC059076]|uniref:LuxR C-terminal-related transcriptional regulator n=1 Tax=unclassified Streptomyces TaxID=2593676 RepID=UPI0036A4FD2F